MDGTTLPYYLPLESWISCLQSKASFVRNTAGFSSLIIISNASFATVTSGGISCSGVPAGNVIGVVNALLVEHPAQLASKACQYLYQWRRHSLGEILPHLFLSSSEFQ